MVAHVGSAFAWDAAIPRTLNTPLADSILAANKGNILTPEMVGSLRPLAKPIGWEFQLVDSRQNSLNSAVFRLQEIRGNEYYFEYLDPSLSRPKVDRYKWVNGYSHYAINNTNKNNPLEYAIGGEEQCKFTLGLCEYKSYGGRAQKQFTEFRDGVWVHRQTSLTSREGDLVKWIYDASGFPLYYYYESLKTGGSFEQRRLER
jgi:hypothetical protein